MNEVFAFLKECGAFFIITDNNGAPAGRPFNSMIADGCIIEGTVENSVLFRGVHVGKGAVVRNSVLFSGTVIGDGSSINCVVADKDVTVSPRSTLSGAPTLPFFIGKNRNV